MLPIARLTNISKKYSVEQKTCNKTNNKLVFLYCVAAPNNYVCKRIIMNGLVGAGGGWIGNFIILPTFNKGEDVPAVKLISGIETL